MKISKEPKLNWYYFQRIISNNSFTGYEIIEDCYEVGLTSELALLAFYRKDENKTYTNIEVKKSFLQENMILVDLVYGHLGNEVKWRWTELK